MTDDKKNQYNCWSYGIWRVTLSLRSSRISSMESRHQWEEMTTNVLCWRWLAQWNVWITLGVWVRKFQDESFSFALSFCYCWCRVAGDTCMHSIYLPSLMNTWIKILFLIWYTVWYLWWRSGRITHVRNLDLLSTRRLPSLAGSDYCAARTLTIITRGRLGGAGRVVVDCLAVPLNWKDKLQRGEAALMAPPGWWGKLRWTAGVARKICDLASYPLKFMSLYK